MSGSRGTSTTTSYPTLCGRTCGRYIATAPAMNDIGVAAEVHTSSTMLCRLAS